MKKLLTAAVVAATFVAPAFGADLSPRTYAKAPAMATGVNWTGCYVGGSVGYLTARQKNSEGKAPGSSIFSSSDLAPSHTLSVDGDSATVGANVGCNYQIGMWVLGMETDYSYTSVDASANVAGGAAAGGFTQRFGMQDTFTERARVGYAFDRALIYGTAGVAFAKFRNEAYVYGFEPLGSGYSAGNTEWRVGYVVGGGVEYSLTPKWSIRGEGLYMDFGKKTYNDGYLESSYSFKNTAVVGKLGVNYKIVP